MSGWQSDKSMMRDHGNYNTAFTDYIALIFKDVMIAATRSVDPGIIDIRPNGTWVKLKI
jgi:hypothetical protein